MDSGALDPPGSFRGTLSSPFGRWGHQGSGMFRDSPQVTQPESVKGKFFFFFFFVFLLFFGPLPGHMEGPRVGVESGL